MTETTMPRAVPTAGEARGTRRAALLGLASVIVFVAFAAYRLDRPGLYADELLYVTASLETLGHCEVDAQVSIDVAGCFPLYLNPPYLGALKAWLHAPLLAAGAVDAATLRWPMLLLAALVVGGWVVLASRSFGAGVGIACAVVLAIDPAFTIHARFDWGPAVLAGALKLLLVAAVWQWLARGGRVMLAASIVIALVGIYDKLNFLWVVAGVGIAVLVVAPDRLRTRWRERPLREWSLWLLACLPAVAVVGLVARSASRLDVTTRAADVDLLAGWDHVRALYDQSMSGAFVRAWIGDGAGDPVAWPGRVLLALPVLAGVLAALRPWAWADLGARARHAAFLLVALFGCLAALVVTPQTSGAHHLVMLWPLPWIVGFALLQGIGQTIGRRFGPRPAEALGPVLALAAAVAVVPTLFARQLEHRALWEGRFGFATAFDPALSDLADRLVDTRAARVVSVDWGLHQGLVALAPPAQRGRYVDGWTAFNDPPGVDDFRKDRLQDVALRELPVLFVAHAPGRSILPGTAANFAAILRRWSACAEPADTIPGSDGRPLFALVEVRRIAPECGDVD